MGKRSAVWEHFDAKTGEESKCICKHCSLELNRGKQGTTTHLLRHLQRKHPDVYTASSRGASASTSSSSSSSNYSSKRSANQIAGLELLFVQCGGTIDKDYPATANQYGFIISSPCIARIVSGLKLAIKYRSLSCCKKDSNDISPENRESLRNTCMNSKEQKIIVTHGTDTMILTAQHLASDPDLASTKLVIITGSVLPQRFKNSDADFNVGVAIGAANVLQNGIFVVMNGLVIPAADCIRENNGVFMNEQLKMAAIAEREAALAVKLAKEEAFKLEQAAAAEAAAAAAAEMESNKLQNLDDTQGDENPPTPLITPAEAGLTL
eukprot:Awhi_evm1s15382